MSMPSFPPNGADMTREEALTMIIASIAMEELALSHILNAEGEKLQYILGTLPGTFPCASPQDVLAVNKSVTSLVEAVTQNQMLLKNKLDQVLEFCPHPSPAPPPCKPEPCPPPCQPNPCPCPPPCRPNLCPPPEPCPPPCQARCCEKNALQLIGQREEMLWNLGCRLPWRQRSHLGKDIRWNKHTPTQIQLDLKHAYMVQFTLNVRAAVPAEGTGTILLHQSPCGAFTDTLPLRFSMERLACGSQTLQYAAVLYPRTDSGCEAGLSLLLDGGSPLCVERAMMDIVEL